MTDDYDEILLEPSHLDGRWQSLGTNGMQVRIVGTDPPGVFRMRQSPTEAEEIFHTAETDKPWPQAVDSWFSVGDAFKAFYPGSAAPVTVRIRRRRRP